MHLIPVLRCPEGPDGAEVLRSVAAAALPVSVALPPMLLEQLGPNLLEDLHSSPVEWVRTGYSAPWFAMLPDTEIQRQLVREETALRAAGLEPGPLLFTGPWAPHLPSSFAAAGVRSLILAGDDLDAVATGVVSHLDAVLAVVPLVSTAGVGSLDTSVDDAVAVEIRPSGAPGAVRDLAGRRCCDVTTVERFLSGHAPAGRRVPAVGDWEQRLIADPDRGVLHRKLIALVRRLPERLSDEAERALLAAEAGRHFESSDPRTAAAAMAVARRRIERERRRGDDWARVGRTDWDADGRVEMHIELPELSIVLAPARSGAMPVIDHKPSGWPVSTVSGEPGWSLVRMVRDLSSGAPLPVELTETSVTEKRGGSVVVLLTGEPPGGGRLDISLEAMGSRLVVGFDLQALPASIIGPELRVALEGPVRARVDGSPWREVDGPEALSGHRFRLAGGERQLLVSSLTPASLFLRPGVDGDGIVAWPHWPVEGTGGYEMSVELVTSPAEE